jgi:Tol biopolymer transport system component/predicted Ser/Thr protein kinase
MPLAAGTHLGPYEILAPIGAGGMGEVYKARDTRLDRIVAVKISAEQFSERFEREARAVAALNHPHICTLHDVGPNYLVMEYIQGQPLKGPLAPDEALKYGAQICDALEAAHKQGVVHRDLKPANIMVTKAGVKLLDFGLAKLTRGRGASPVGSVETIALTQANTILGTLQYMSPEQLEGKDADARSDIFAFGAVLYEMITGRQAFAGSSPASVIAAIMGGQSGSLQQLPRGIDHVVKVCLAKDPDARWQSATDIRRELEWLAEASLPEPAATPVPRVGWRERIAWGLAVAFLGGFLLLAAPHWRAGPEAERVRFAIYPPHGTDFAKPPNSTIGAAQFALSQDGRTIAFVAGPAGVKPSLWLRPLDEAAAHPIAGTENATYPFWSPDSRRIGFFADGKLKTIMAIGGPAQVIAQDVADPRGGSWGADGKVVFSATASGVNVVSASGGFIASVSKLDPSVREGSHRWPQFLPDGRHIIFHVRSGVQERRGVYGASLDGTRKFLVHSEWSGAYSPSGHLLYFEGDVLMARSFDPARMQLSGEPVALVEHVAPATNGLAAISISTTGTFAYANATLERGRLTWFDRGGRTLDSVGAEGDYTDFRLSPDGKRVAASLVDPQSSMPAVWMADLTRGSVTRFTFDPSLEASPVWSPDGARVAFRSLRSGMLGFYEKSAAGGGQDKPMLVENTSPSIVLTDWSPDGSTILYSRQLATTGFDLWLLPADGQGKPAQYLNSPADETQGAFAPNGRFVAYTSNESGRLEVYVQTLPASDRKWQISTGGGHEPRWRRDGRELYYLSEDRKLMAVPVTIDAGFTAGAPKALFQTGVPAGVNPFRTNYVPAGDGQRFLVNTVRDDTGPEPITVVLHWTAGLKK